jgi:hypothetical protein
MPDRLAEIRARLDAATPGEWPFGEMVRHLLPPDADLIAHAPADIAWLLAEVERLRTGNGTESLPDDSVVQSVTKQEHP